jgi:hypothetical protein
MTNPLKLLSYSLTMAYVGELGEGEGERGERGEKGERG